MTSPLTASQRSSWVVLKFGGTSVATRNNWNHIASIARQRLATGARVLIVHSAVSGITDRLEKLLDAAVQSDFEAALTAIELRHRELAASLGIAVSAALEKHFVDLRQIATGIAAVGEVSDRIRARVMASGELMASELGTPYLRSQGLDVSAVDARDMLRAESRTGQSSKASFLSATCVFTPDLALQRRLAALTPVVMTQGFIATDDDGNTVLLGRGGSDTSAAYFAAKLAAARLEIWTDVPGMFSANPRSTPSARQLLVLHYDEAQEIATAGAKVLHPRCIMPARQYQIPLYVFATQSPHLLGTEIRSTPGSDAAQVKAVCIKKGITLLALDSPGMWHQVGFLADAFQVFKRHGMSVDLVSTSETNVTMSLDPQANTLDESLLKALVAELSQLGRVQVIGPCASVSLVGRNIRAILHQLGAAFALFEEQKIYLVSQAANDLNFTFVVDENQGDRLVEQLHDLLVRPVHDDLVLGQTWEQLFSVAPVVAAPNTAWWWTQRAHLLQRFGARDSAYVYNLDVVRERVAGLRGIAALSRVLYAMKANSHPEVLRAVYAAGAAIECVSRGEIERAFTSIPKLDPGRVLFTPNFAPRAEYVWGFEQGVRVTVDNLFCLAEWPDVFRGREIFVRIDPGQGRGHHKHVRTGGEQSKFGVAASEFSELQQHAERASARIVGLHAHVGSGVFEISSWSETAGYLRDLIQRFADVRVIDVGGGLGVPDRVGKPPLSLDELAAGLQALRAASPTLEIWMEPGRYVVAEAGVLLARVTQTKSKGDVRYVGIATGMNSLIRPALYGAHHDIVNLTRVDEPASEIVNVVGPICESADYLGHDRLLPPSREGDVLLIATAGAYGAAMASHYNLRAPAEEIIF